jgi:homocitrate synthase NifV
MSFHLLPAIVVNDSTLRDSEQAAHVALSCRNRIAIARALEQTGVDEIELALPSGRGIEIDDLASIRAALGSARPILWGPATKGTVNAAVRAGLNAIYLSVPLSGRHASPKGIERVVEYASEHGLSVAISGEDASRADLEVVCDVIAAAEAAGASRFRYVDTMGVLHPLRTHGLFRRLCAETDTELEFRGHDDFGLATANTLAAIQGGATHVSVSTVRTGERPGIAPLTDIASAIRLSTVHHTRIDFSRLPALATLVSTTTGRPFASNRPNLSDSTPWSMVRDLMAPLYAVPPVVTLRAGG